MTRILLNIRLACSVNFSERKLLLAVNNHEPVIKSVSDINPLYPQKPIGIFHSVDKEGLEVGYESGATFGNIYDLRLYTRACSPLDLWILSTGTKRELYSYAPSIYQLAGIWLRGAELIYHGASSNHPGVVIVGMADGSARTVSDTIDLNVWRAAATVAGSETLSFNK